MLSKIVKEDLGGSNIDDELVKYFQDMLKRDGEFCRTVKDLTAIEFELREKCKQAKH